MISRTAAGNGALTLLRVAILIGLASAIWIPIGVGVGLRPDLTERVQPIAQFLAAFRPTCSFRSQFSSSCTSTSLPGFGSVP